jgi:VanZ family protein
MIDMGESFEWAQVKHSFHHFFWFWLPPLAYMIAIFFMSSQSNPEIGGDVPDYVFHSLGYFLLTLLLIRLLLAEQPRIVLRLTAIFSGLQKNKDNGLLFWQIASISGVLISIGYGITDEVHQYFTPGRHCSFSDLLANSFGAFMAYGISMLDYLILSRTSFHQKWMTRLNWIRTISYSNFLYPNPKHQRSAKNLSFPPAQSLFF